MQEHKPFGEHTIQINTCDEIIQNAVFELCKMYELHQKYDGQKSIFYLRQVDDLCSKVGSWIAKRDHLIQEACISAGREGDIPALLG
jgi:hypothetical protein